MFSTNGFAAIMWLIVLATIGFAGAQSGLSHPDVEVVVNGGVTTSRYLITTRPMPTGVLVSTAPTFVSNGITSEFSTLVIGTVVNGLYSRIESTSSRVFYRVPLDGVRHQLAAEQPKLAASTAKAAADNLDDNDGNEWLSSVLPQLHSSIIQSKNPSVDKDYYHQDQSHLEERTEREMSDEAFSRRLESAAVSPGFGEQEDYDDLSLSGSELTTVTYVGFSDYKTTIGSTVVVFMPQSTAATYTTVVDRSQQEKPAFYPGARRSGRRLAISQAPVFISTTVRPTSVVSSVLSGSRLGTVDKPNGEDRTRSSGDSTADTNTTLFKIAPSDYIHSTVTTRVYNTIDFYPTGLATSIGGTVSRSKVTTVFTTLVYGTFIDGRYAKVIKSTSSIYYRVDKTSQLAPTITAKSAGQISEYARHNQARAIKNNARQQLIISESELEKLRQSGMDLDGSQHAATPALFSSLADDTEEQLVLRTYFTTHTYFTTLQKSGTQSVKSSYSTESSIATEQLSTKPVTFYTTFTYFSTYRKGGETSIATRFITQSRLGSRPVLSADSAISVRYVTKTYFTTYTYLTTSYIGTSSVVQSRFVTSSNTVTSKESIYNIEGTTTKQNRPHATIHHLKENVSGGNRSAPAVVSIAHGVLSGAKSKHDNMLTFKKVSTSNHSMNNRVHKLHSMPMKLPKLPQSTHGKILTKPLDSKTSLFNQNMVSSSVNSQAGSEDQPSRLASTNRNFLPFRTSGVRRKTGLLARLAQRKGLTVGSSLNGLSSMPLRSRVTSTTTTGGKHTSVLHSIAPTQVARSSTIKKTNSSLFRPTVAGFGRASRRHQGLRGLIGVKRPHKEKISSPAKVFSNMVEDEEPIDPTEEPLTTETTTTTTTTTTKASTLRKLSFDRARFTEGGTRNSLPLRRRSGTASGKGLALLFSKVANDDTIADINHAEEDKTSTTTTTTASTTTVSMIKIVKRKQVRKPSIDEPHLRSPLSSVRRSGRQRGRRRRPSSSRDRLRRINQTTNEELALEAEELESNHILPRRVISRRQLRLVRNKRDLLPNVGVNNDNSMNSADLDLLQESSGEIRVKRQTSSNRARRLRPSSSQREQKFTLTPKVPRQSARSANSGVSTRSRSNTRRTIPSARRRRPAVQAEKTSSPKSRVEGGAISLRQRLAQAQFAGAGSETTRKPTKSTRTTPRSPADISSTRSSSSRNPPLTSPRSRSPLLSKKTSVRPELSSSKEQVLNNPNVFPTPVNSAENILVIIDTPVKTTFSEVSGGKTVLKEVLTASTGTRTIAFSQLTVTTINNEQKTYIGLESTTLSGGEIRVSTLFVEPTEINKEVVITTQVDGRRFPSVITSTVALPAYTVQPVISSQTPPSTNAGANPLTALLQQLLGAQGLPGAGSVGAQPSPQLYSTIYSTSTYVTTVTKKEGTTIPIFFRGRLTDTVIYDVAVKKITATEVITTSSPIIRQTAAPAFGGGLSAVGGGSNSFGLNPQQMLLQQLLQNQLLQQQQQQQQQLQQRQPLQFPGIQPSGANPINVLHTQPPQLEELLRQATEVQQQQQQQQSRGRIRRALLDDTRGEHSKINEEIYHSMNKVSANGLERPLELQVIDYESISNSIAPTFNGVGQYMTSQAATQSLESLHGKWSVSTVSAIDTTPSNSVIVGVAELHSSHQPPSAHQPYRKRTLTTRLMANGIPVLVAAENRMASGGGLPSKTVTLPAVFLSDAMVLSPSTQTPLRPEIPQLSTSTLESRFHRIHTLYTTYTHYNDMQPSASTSGQRHSLKIVSNVITAPASRVITTVFTTKTRLISVSSVPSEAASGETHQHASSSTIEVTRVVVTEAQQLASETVKRQTTSPFHTEFGQKLTAIKSTTLSHASQQVKNGISTQTAQPSSLEAHKIPNLSSQVSSYFSTTSQPVPELINTKLDKQTFSDKSQQQQQHNTSGTTGSPADAAASASAFLSAATYLDKAHLYNSAQFQPALYVNHDALSANFPSSQEIDLEEAGSGVALTSEPTLQTVTPVVTLSSASLENQTPQAVDSIKNIYSPAITSDVASPAIHTSPAPSGIVLHAANVDPIAAPPATATTTESSSAFSLTNIAGGLLGLGGLGAASMSGLGFGSGLVDTAAGIIRNVLPIAARRDGEVHSDDVRPNRIPFDRLTPPRGSASFQQFDNNELRRKRIISRRKNNGYLAVRGPNGQIIGPLAEEKYGHSVVFAQPQRRVNPPQAHSSSSKHSDFRKRPGSLYGNKIFRPSLHNRRPLASHRKQDSFVPNGFIAIVTPSSETKQSTVSQGRPEFNHDLLSHKHTQSYRPTRLESLVSNKRAPSVEMKAPPRPITPRQDAVISEYRPGFDVLLKSSTRYSTITQVNDHRIISTLANTSNQIHATPLSIFAYDHRTVGITDRLDEKVNDLNKGPYLYLRNTPDTISLTSIVNDEFAEENDFVDRATEDDQQLAASVFATNHSESGSSDEWVAAFDNSLEVDLSSSQPDDFQEKTTDRPGFVSTLHTIASVEGVNRIVGTNVFASVVPMVTRPGVIRFYESNEATTLPSPQTTRVLPTKTKTRSLFRQSVTLIEPVTDELSTEGFSRLPPPLFNDIETTTKNLNPFQRKISTTQTNWFDKYNPVSEEYSDVQQASADNSNTFITRIRSQDEVVEESLGSNNGNRLDVGTTTSQYTTESTPLTPVSIDTTPGAGQTVLYSSVEQLPTHTVEYKNSAEFRSESTPALVTKSRETISNTLQSSTPAVNESQSRRRLITRLADRIKQTLRQSIQGKRQNVRSSVAQKRFTLSNRHQHTTTIRAEYTPQNYAGTRVFNGFRWPSVKSTSSSSSSQPSRAVQQIIPENSNILSHRPPLENLDSIDHTITDLDTGKNSPHLSITTGSSTTILGPDAKNLHPETRTTKRLDTATFIVGSSTVFKQEFTRPALPVQNIHEITEINHGPDALQTIHITRTEHLTRTVTATKTEVRLSGASTVTKTSLITSILTPITIVSTVIGSSTAVATLNTATPTRLVQLVKPTAVTAPATLPDISETSTEGQTSTKQQTKERKLDGRTETITNPTYIVSERDSEDNTDVHKGVRENSEVNRVVLNPGIQRQVVVDRPAVVTDSCKTPCRAALNLACRKYSGGYQCVCKPSYAKSRSDGSCEETSTYVLQILLDRVRNLPLTYRRHFRDSTTREHKALSTLTKTGVEESLNHSPFSERVQNVALMDYKSTRFTGQKFEHVENGLVAELMVQVTKSTGDKNTEQVQLEHSLLRSIARRNFSLGDKDLIVSRHTDAITALDFDECQDSEYHDCHDYAICRNLAGSFTCACRSGMTDLGEPQRPGRICSAESADCTECSSHGHCYLSPSDSSLSCRCRRWYAGDRCQINLHVLLTAVLVLAAILSFFLCYCCYMCCRRKRHNHTAPPMVFTGTDGFLRHRSSSIHPGLERRAMLDSSSSDTSAASPHTLIAAPFDARKPHAIPTPLHIDCNPTVTSGVDTVDGYRRTGGIVSRMSSGRTAATSCYQEDRSLASVGVANTAAQLIPRVTKYYARRRQRSSNDDRSSAAATEVEGSACQGSSQLWSRSNHGAGASRSHAIQRHLLSRLNPSTAAGREQWRAASESSNATSASSRRQDTGVSLNPSGGVARRSRSSETGGYQADTSRACSRAGIRPAAAVAHAVFRERTMSEARSFDETTVRPSVRSYPSGSAVGGATTTSHRSSLAFSDTQTYTDDRHTMAERDEASTFVTPVRQLFRPIIDSDSASHLSHDSLCLGYGPYR